MTAHAVSWDALDWEVIRRGMERKTFAGEGATLALYRIQPGHELRPHPHCCPQPSFLLCCHS